VFTEIQNYLEVGTDRIRITNTMKVLGICFDDELAA